MTKSTWKGKVIASILVFCMMFSYCSVYATFLTDFQGSGLGLEDYSANIDMNAYVKTEKGEESTEYYATTKDVNLVLNVHMKVNAGYVKNPVLTIQKLDEEVFEIDETRLDSEFVQSVSGNRIIMTKLNEGEDVVVEVPIRLKEVDYYYPEKTKSNVEFVLTGTYADTIGERVEISKSCFMILGWNSITNAGITTNVEKSFSFKQDGKNYLLVQYGVNVELGEESVSFPVESTTINFKVPENESLIPQSVSVDALATAFTDGKTGSDVNFTSDNWKYDDTAKTIEIKKVNSGIEEEAGKYITPQGKDKYIVTVTYEVTGSNKKLETEIYSTIKVFSSGTTADINANGTLEYNLENTAGSLVTYGIEYEKATMSKGNLYANYNLKENEYYETEYSSIMDINISKADFVTTVEVKENDEYFTDSDENKYPAVYSGYNNTYYKSTIFSKANLDQILGENGKLKILSESGETLITIDKNQVANNDGNIVVTYSKKVGKIAIKIDKPEKEGILTILNKKAIGKLSYPKSRVIKFNKFVTEYTASALYNGKIKDEIGQIKRTIKLKGTKTSAIISMSNRSLSTLTENKNIDLKVALNNYNDKTDLYKNPVFEIKFPKEIEEIKVNSASILYGNNELSLANIESYKDNGQIIFKISVKGTQTKYSLVELTEGTNILLNVDIKVNIYTPTSKGKVDMYYYNESATNYDSAVPWKMDTARNDATIVNANGKYETEISFEGPSGVVTGEKLSGYNENKKLSSLSQGIKVDRILTNVEAKKVNSEMIIMNNSDKDMEKISILGRIPFEGNTSVVSNEDLGTTIDTEMIDEVIETYGVYKNVDIYYSENKSANKDLNNESNKWTKNHKELKDIKSFLIIYNDSLKVGEVTTFSYGYAIPKNIECNESIFSSFAVYYTSDGKELVQESDKLGLETVKTPKIEVNITSDAGKTVTEGQTVRYTVDVENKGEVNAENVSFTLDIPKGATYIKYVKPVGNKEGYYKEEKDIRQLKIDVGNIAAGEKKVYSYSVLVNGTSTELEEAEVKADAEGIDEKAKGEKAEDENSVDMKIQDNTEKREVEEPDIKVTFSQDKNGHIIAEKENLLYNLKILNNTNLSMGATKVKLKNGTIIDIKEYNALVDEGKESKDVEFIYGKTINNIKVKVKFPEEIEFKKAYKVIYDEYSGKEEQVTLGHYDSGTRTFEIEIGELLVDEALEPVIEATTNKLKDVHEKEITTELSVTADGVSNIVTPPVNNTLCKPKLDITFTSSVGNKYLKEDETITFNFIAKNIGKVNAKNVFVEYKIPEGLEPISGYYYLRSKPEHVDMHMPSVKNGAIYTAIESGDTLNAEFKLKASKIEENEKVLENYVTVKINNVEDEIEVFETEKLVKIIQKDANKPVKTSEESYDDVDNTQNPSNETDSNNEKSSNKSNKATVSMAANNVSNTGKYKISGKAWNDADRNGKKDDSESGVSQVGVKLYNAKTNKVIDQTTTDDSGEYVFSKIKNGKYYIVFSYDKSKYALTEYHKAKVDASKNSDAIITNSLAITDVININSASAGDIDIGLMDPSAFDLRLDKNITKVTVNTKKGTKDYKYNTNLAKVDIHAKELSGAKVYVEYAITVTNKGEIPGFARSIVDYIPKGMSFNTDLNKDWFEKDGKIYTNALSKEEIKPGESKTVKLVLLKQMSTTNTGTISNSAEIAESFNDRAAKDIDSVAGNNQDTEDDYSTADIIVSVKTGGTLLNITALVISLLIAITIGYVFKKNVVERMRRW